MVKVGQVYRDKDKRMSNRYLLVWKVDSGDSGYAECFDSTRDGRQVTMRNHSLRIQTLRRRFELVKDV